MDRQPCTKVNVPSYRFTDVEMATERSLSVKLISQGQGLVVRGFSRAIHGECLMRSLSIELLNEGVEAVLLLQAV
jgi:hypothetical protein